MMKFMSKNLNITNCPIHAALSKKSSKHAIIFTITLFLIISFVLLWGLTAESYYDVSDPVGPKDERIRLGINWFHVPLYHYDSGDPCEVKDTVFGTNQKRIIYTTKYEPHVGNIMAIVVIFLIAIAGPLVVDSLNRRIYKNTSLTITDTQVTGSYSSNLSKKEVQLPLDNINSLTVTHSFMDNLRGGRTLEIATASEIIKIHFIDNAEEIISFFTTITSKNKNADKPLFPEYSQTATDKLKELTELKNSGLITDEEFTKKCEDILSKF